MRSERRGRYTAGKLCGTYTPIVQRNSTGRESVKNVIFCSKHFFFAKIRDFLDLVNLVPYGKGQNER